jgi:hypothetical protein
VKTESLKCLYCTLVVVQVYQLGEGTPQVAVVGAIHGDEPCGPRGIERLLADDPDVDRPVKLIVANEEASAQDVRYVDEDLNRAYPGDTEAETHEGRLAAHLRQELEGCTTLSLHSTQSYAEPFAITPVINEITQAVVPRLPTEILVESGSFAEGRFIEQPHTLEVECGLQQSEEAAENAYWLIRAFLAATNALPEPTTDDRIHSRGTSEVSVFRLQERIGKPPADTYEVQAHNFERVAAGETFAVADGESFTADEEFYPVLMSAYGYRDVFGYAAEKLGTLS